MTQNNQTEGVTSRKNMEYRKTNAGVASRESRVTFYSLAITVVFTILGGSIDPLWLNSSNTGTLHKFMYVFFSAATIPYVGLLVRSMCNDVLVPSYCLGEDGKLRIYLAMMILNFCIACNIKEGDVVAEMSIMATMVLLGVIAIVQLYYPAEDLNHFHVVVLMFLGVTFASLGWVAQESWTSFFATLCLFPVFIGVFHHGFSLAAKARQHHHHQPLLPV